jgi:ribonuclease P protein component
LNACRSPAKNIYSSGLQTGAIFVICIFQRHILTKEHTLGGSERLKSRKKIGEIFRSGKKMPLPPFLVYYHLKKTSGQEPVLQMGTGVSTKHFKKAVSRNRVKRLIRETYRQQNSVLKSALVKGGYSMEIFIIYTDKTLPEYQALYDKMNVVLQRLVAFLGNER